MVAAMISGPKGGAGLNHSHELNLVLRIDPKPGAEGAVPVVRTLWSAEARDTKGKMHIGADCFGRPHAYSASRCVSFSWRPNIAKCRHKSCRSKVAATPHTEFQNKTGLALKG